MTKSFFPQKEEVFLTAQTQSGRWYDINTSKSKKEEKEDVFTLGINHGVAPKDGSYAYIVVPGKTSAQEMKPIERECHRNSVRQCKNTGCSEYQTECLDGDFLRSWYFQT